MKRDRLMHNHALCQVSRLSEPHHKKFVFDIADEDCSNNFQILETIRGSESPESPGSNLLIIRDRPIYYLETDISEKTSRTPNITFE